MRVKSNVKWVKSSGKPSFEPSNNKTEERKGKERESSLRFVMLQLLLSALLYAMRDALYVIIALLRGEWCCKARTVHHERTTGAATREISTKYVILALAFSFSSAGTNNRPRQSSRIGVARPRPRRSCGWTTDFFFFFFFLSVPKCRFRSTRRVRSLVLRASIREYVQHNQCDDLLNDDKKCVTKQMSKGDPAEEKSDIAVRREEVKRRLERPRTTINEVHLIVRKMRASTSACRWNRAGPRRVWRASTRDLLEFGVTGFAPMMNTDAISQ